MKRWFLCFLFGMTAASPLSAASYDVGPSQPLATLSGVPWKNLQPGDVVNIHVKPGGYHEKFQISASGTAAQHIVVRGIPDPVTGLLPIIDGNGAIEDPSCDYRSANFSIWGVIIVSPRKTGYVYGAYHVSFVDIETLDIRNATYTSDGSVTFTDQFGVVRGYDTFACGIYIEWAHDLAVRGCEISNCGNGVFANSKNQAAQSSQRLLIEKNYFHDNSNPPTPDPDNPNGPPLSNGFGEHHIYVESAGSVIQFNRFGKLRANARGVAIKDRSSGQVIRYNDFDMDGESNVLALMDPQGGIDFIDTQPDYPDSYVYGNVVSIENYTGGINAFWWGSFNGPGNLPDGRSSYATLHRRTLYFYNNTVVCHHNAVGLFFLPDQNYTASNPTYENVDCRNNVFFADTSVQSSVYNALHFCAAGTTNGGGEVTLGINWISPGWSKDTPSHTWSGPLTGTSNLIVGDAAGANNPHFIDINAHNYHVLAGSNVIDSAGALPAPALPANNVALEYLAPQNSQSRTLQGLAMDLGALESTGLASPPPPAGALQFSNATYNVNEGAGSAMITVTRVGGSLGEVSVAYSTTSNGSATDTTDFTPVTGFLTWPDGDSSPRSFLVPIIDDISVEVAETVSLGLFNPTGGAVLGATTAATLTISDNDTPPSTLMYAIAASNNVLFLFKSDAPGTPLSFSYFSGLVSGDVLHALAVQPGSGRLFAVGSASVLYSLNPFTGAASAAGPAFAPAVNGATMDLAFDRVNGQLRLMTSSGQNLRLDPATGAVISVDTPLSFASGDPNAATTPLGAGLDVAFSGGAQTTYVIDAASNTLAKLGSSGGAPVSPAAGQLTTVGPLGMNANAQCCLKIPSGAAFGWAAMNVGTNTSSGLYAIDLASGSAAFMGTIRNSEQVRAIAIAPPRDVWKLARFGASAGNATVAADNADPDGNGVSNLMEYALGAQPGSPSSVALPTVSSDGGYLALTFTRPVAATDVSYTVQVSADLVSWQNGSTYTFGGSTASNVFTTQTLRSTANDIETITVRDNVPIASSKARFMRLKVSSP